MKHTFTLLFLLVGLSVKVLAQASAVSEPVVLNFCGLNVPVEAGCTPSSKNQLTCTDYQLTWMYLDFAVLKTYPEQYARQMQKKHKNTDRQPFDCFILDTPAKGFRLSYPTEQGGIAYQLIAYGIAKGQPVLIDLVLPTDPEKTADLPAAARQILRLHK